MKIKNLIKADFFINPVLYGVYAVQDLDLQWKNIIKPLIPEIENTKKIHNPSVSIYIQGYRDSIKSLL